MAVLVKIMFIFLGSISLLHSYCTDTTNTIKEENVYNDVPNSSAQNSKNMTLKSIR